MTAAGLHVACLALWLCSRAASPKQLCRCCNSCAVAQRTAGTYAAPLRLQCTQPTAWKSVVCAMPFGCLRPLCTRAHTPQCGQTNAPQSTSRFCCPECFQPSRCASKFGARLQSESSTRADAESCVFLTLRQPRQAQVWPSAPSRPRQFHHRPQVRRVLAYGGACKWMPTAATLGCNDE